MKKIIFTGGHVTPAIATIEVLKQQFPTWDIVFIGRKYALEGSTIESEEYRLIPSMGIRFIPITAGRWKWNTLIKIGVGVFQAFSILLRERPSLVMSYGGYVAFPVAVAARVIGIPVLTHEQTAHPGIANRIIGVLAHHCMVTFADTVRFFPKHKTSVTGLPIRKKILDEHVSSPFPSPIRKPVLCITGGSTGSASINTVVSKVLPILTKRFFVVHQIGRSSPMPQKQRDYLPLEFIPLDMYSWLIHHAHIVVCRSGANTVMELSSVGAVALCIPLPWSSQNEQFFNAQFLAKNGGGTILEQKNMTETTLVATIHSIMDHWENHKSRANNGIQTIPRHGAKRVADTIAAYA